MRDKLGGRESAQCWCCTYCPFSMPETAASLTVRSTFLSTSLVASTGPFCWTSDVVKHRAAGLEEDVAATRQIGVVL